MKHANLFVIFLFLIPLAVFPQADNLKSVREIRDQYRKANKEIEKIEKSEEAALQSELAVNELVINKLNKSWPAVGNYSVVYRFYYKQAGEEPYPDHLVMVKKKTVSAAREYYEESLFSDDGGLVFFFLRDESGAKHRLYFRKGNLIEYLGEGDKEALLMHASKARAYKQLFMLSIQ